MEPIEFPLFFWLFFKIVFTLNTAGNIDYAIPKFFYCYGDYCNMNGQIEYCDDILRKCNPCTNILDDCFTPDQPQNCTSTCIKHEVEQLEKAAKQKPCTRLTEISNGRHNGSLSDVHKPGDIIRINCKENYRLIGTRQLECKDYGIWSGDIPKCEEVVCPALVKVKNGDHNGSSDRHVPGHIVVTSCARGHQLHGQSTTTCDSNGFWTNPLPLCEQITCTRPYPIRNGRWYQSGTIQYVPGNTVSAQCEQDYMMDGSPLWHCSNEGHWKSNDSFLPICLQLGESSSGFFSSAQCSNWMIVLGVGLVCSVIINIVQCCCIRRLTCRKDTEKLKDLEGSEDEQIKLIPKTDKVTEESEIDDVVSLRNRQAKEKVVLGGSDNIPEPNNVRNNTKEQSIPLNNAERHQNSSVIINVSVNNENTNNNSAINRTSNQHTQPKTLSNDDDTKENPKVAPPKASGFDKAPVEESGTTCQPTQPESSTITAPSQPTSTLRTKPELSDETPPRQPNPSGYTVPIQPDSAAVTPPGHHGSHSRDHVPDDIEDINAGIPLQQTLNNEQDRGPKVVLPNTEINRDDLEV